MPKSLTNSQAPLSTKSLDEVSISDLKKLEKAVRSQAQLIQSQQQALKEMNRRIADLRAVVTAMQIAISRLR